MTKSLVMSLIGAAGMAAALLVGCGDNDAKPASSKAGQSCVRTADCADGLSCIANVCYAGAPAGGEAGQTGTPGPVLGGEGESCTSRRDCADGLACFNQRCTATTGAGEGGAPGTTAQLGDRGETCRVNADCAKDLVCVPSTENSGIGVCDLANYGIPPSDKTCNGECKTATDCCELPIDSQTDTVHSCQDVTAALVGLDCTNPQLASTAQLCFLDATYCTGCSATTWKCTNNQCVYNVACTDTTYDVPNGCPQLTRTGRKLSECDTTAKKCAPPAPTDVCTDDASCTDMDVADDADTCSAGECTCYAGDHQCYRKCKSDIECDRNSTCDTKTHVCVQTPFNQCTDDEDCASNTDSADFKCNKGQCKAPCKSDRDCSMVRIPDVARALTPFNFQVCAADGFCAFLGCSNDTQCGVSGNVKLFCVEPPPQGAADVSSAITN